MSEVQMLGKRKIATLVGKKEETIVKLNEKLEDTELMKQEFKVLQSKYSSLEH